MSDDGEEEHVHYIDPSMDGHCVACIGKRHIYCLDGTNTGDGSIGDKSDYSLGSCQPSWAYCTNAGRIDNYAFMFFRECEYTNVKSPDDDSEFSEDLIEFVVTDEMAEVVMKGEKYTMLDFLFMPN